VFPLLGTNHQILPSLTQADDGNGANIQIPSVLIGHADGLTITSEIMAGSNVRYLA
jgi:hypothetical protein